MVEQIDQPQIEGINQNFWNDFGNPSDTDSFVAAAKLLMVRHAQSEENLFWAENDVSTFDQLSDDLIYKKLLDCQLTELGVKQAKQLQPLVNRFEFAEDTVYVSPHRRTIQTLCHMLDTHPQKSRLTVVILPLAKEVMASYGNVPLPFAQLKADCRATVIDTHGFKAVDSSILEQQGSLWYIKQLTLADKAVQESYLEKLGQHAEEDHIPVFKQIFAERDQNQHMSQVVCLESNTDLYQRALNLRKQVHDIVQETEQRCGPIKGHQKVLIVAHGRIIRAFASAGVDTESDQWIGSFCSENTEATPFKMQENGDYKQQVFTHCR